MVKLYVKYSKDYPYLPEAVAESKMELAKDLGISHNTVYSSFSRGMDTYQVVEYEDEEWENMEKLIV